MNQRSRWTSDRIRSLRKRYRLTREKFAVIIGVTQWAVKKWEYLGTLPGEPTCKVLDWLDEQADLQPEMAAPETEQGL